MPTLFIGGNAWRAEMMKRADAEVGGPFSLGEIT
jgi:hypothetical protein